MNAFFIFAAKYLYLLPILALALYVFMQGRAAWKQMTLFAIPAAILSYALGVIGNSMYYDPRPFVVGRFTPLVAHAADNGFPSDHTLLAATLAMIGWYWDRRLGAALWAIAALIAFARVYVGVHHVIDVTGSMLFAIVGVSAVYLMYARLWHSKIR